MISKKIIGGIITNNIDVIYKKYLNLYDDSFLLEYNRVAKLTKELNDKIGFPIFKIKIDVINSELKVENRFVKKNKNKFKKFIRSSGLINARQKTSIR